MLIPIQITPKAATEIKHILATKNIPEDYFLRVVAEAVAVAAPVVHLVQVAVVEAQDHPVQAVQDLTQ